MKKRWRRFWVGILVAALVLTACGQPGGLQSGNSGNQQEQSAAELVQYPDCETMYREMEQQDYMKGDWQAGELSNPVFYRKIDWTIPEVFQKEAPKDELYYHDAKFGKDAFYYVYCAYNAEESRSDEVLAIYDYKTGTASRYKLSNCDEDYLFIGDLSISKDTLMLFRQWDNGEDSADKDEKKLVAHRWLGDSMDEGVDLYPAVREYIEKPKPNYTMELDIAYEAAGDCFYLLSQDQNKIVTISSDGTLGKVWQDGQKKFTFFAQTPEGVQLFESYPSNGTEAEIFCLQDGEKKVLYQGQYIDSKMACIDSKGNVVYIAGDGQNVIEWQVTTGERRKIFSATSECLKYPQGILREENGDLAIFDGLGQSIGLKHIAGAGRAMEAVIKVRSTVYTDPSSKTRLNNYALSHPGISFEYETVGSWDEREISLNKIYSDISKGEGPDLLTLTREEMHTLAEKGCLLNLSDILEPEGCQGIYEGILKNGFVGDQMYMMPMYASARFFYVRKDVWDKPVWSLPELMEAVEKLNEQNSLTAAAFEKYGSVDADSLLLNLIQNLEAEGFVDVREKKCSLNGQEFRKVLEFCKKYGLEEKNGYANDKGVKALKNGECALLLENSGGFLDYSHDHAYLGDEYIVVGLPGCGRGTLYGGMGIAVNKDTAYPELMKDIVNTIYSPEYAGDLYTLMVPLRKDTYQGRVLNAGDLFWGEPEKAYLEVDSHTYTAIDAKPDGTSYLTDYLEYLDSIHPIPRNVELQTVQDIILEEAPAYFAGDKSLDAVVNIIQSRASLYLAE